MPEKAHIHVFLRNRKKVIFEDYARYVTSHNDKGEFDILPSHANFISLIKNKIIIGKVDGDIQTWDIDHGILRVISNKVEIYFEN